MQWESVKPALAGDCDANLTILIFFKKGSRHPPDMDSKKGSSDRVQSVTSVTNGEIRRLGGLGRRSLKEPRPEVAFHLRQLIGSCRIAA